MKIFIDSPHALIREALASFLSSRHDVTDEVTAEVALKDLSAYRFPYPPPPALPTLALIFETDEDTAAEILRQGYRGYLKGHEGLHRLEQALRVLLRGENWAERHVIAEALYRRPEPSLTRREQEAYALVLQGLSNQEIAERLGLSIYTVKVHISKLLQKLQVKGRQELILKAKDSAKSQAQHFGPYSSDNP